MPTIASEYRLDRDERRRFLQLAAVWLTLLFLPYVWAWLIAAPGMHYSGLLYNPDDQNVHLSWAKQASEGHLFFRDLFTSETLDAGQRPLFTNLFCTAIGTVAVVLHCPLIVVYHVFRLMFALLCLWCFANLSALLTPDKRTRFVALLLVAFSGGAGWLRPLFPTTRFIDRPNGDLMMPEAFTFMSALIFPLFVAAMSLLLLAIWQTEVARREARWRPALAAASAALLLGNIHTYDIVPLDVLLGLWAAFSWFHWFRGRKAQPGDGCGVWPWLAPLIAIAGTLPPFFYQLFVFVNSPEFHIKALTSTKAPKPFELALSVVPMLLLAAIGAVVVWRSRHGRIMLLWLVALCCCIYAPLSFARKMIEGINLPLCFLAASGLSAMLGHVPLQVRRVVLGGVVFGLSISSFNFVNWCLNNAADNNYSRAEVYMPPLYLTSDDYAALGYLGDKAAPDKAILCLPYLGNYVPRETGRTAFIGNWAETLHFFDQDPDTDSGPGKAPHEHKPLRRKIVEVSRFYGLTGPAMTPAEAMSWLHRNHIGSVVVGHYENAGSAKLPLDLPLVFGSHDTRVYSVPD